MGWAEHPARPLPGTPLCLLEDLPEGEGREFAFGDGADRLRILVVRRAHRAWAYVNLCPHNYIPLNDQPDRFVTFDHQWIVCSTHGAVFRYEDGHCEDGPCKGRDLEPVPVVVNDRRVRVAD